MGKKGETISQTKRTKRAKIEHNNDVDALNVIVEAMHEKKALNIVELDLSALNSSICDRFIIANADSTTQVMAIADNVEDKMIEKAGVKVIRRDGNENALWIILDYGDMMVHIFQTECRNFYKLEDLWADAIVTRHDE